nr:immunoglobulin heavy chain junction region [Macaca mulatta]
CVRKWWGYGLDSW